MDRGLLDNVQFDRKPRLKPGKGQGQLRPKEPPRLLSGLIRVLFAVLTVVLLCYGLQWGCAGLLVFLGGK